MGDCPLGQRNDLINVKESIDQGASDKTLWEHHFKEMVKYDQAFKRYRMTVAPPRDSSVAPRITVRIGSSGCGKTRACPPPSDEVYWHPLGKWWDGYSNEKTVVFDEFYGQIPYSTMLRILDRHPLMQETKGASVQLACTRFYFTSNKPPTEWWAKMQEGGQDLAAFIRRLSEFGEVIDHDKDEDLESKFD